MKRLFLTANTLLIIVISGNASGQALPSAVKTCKAIDTAEDRLACYDRLHGRTSGSTDVPIGNDGLLKSDALPPHGPVLSKADASRMSTHWELDGASKQGIFKFEPHRENYLLATFNPNPNEVPYTPFRQLDPTINLKNAELAFQLGFKLKLAESPRNLPVDVWFGYTQRSFWQAANSKASSPFRESNYEPELMAVVPTDMNLAGLKLGFLNLGLVHQSNGGGSILSRSWNRAYLQAGLERGNFQLLARAWKRIGEASVEDDNPDITDYMGYGDLLGSYYWRDHEFSLMSRYNFNTDKGAAQFGWAFPLNSHLNGYLQYFAGYGYSLIDYNAFQRVLGLGVAITY